MDNNATFKSNETIFDWYFVLSVLVLNELIFIPITIESLKN